MKWFRFYSEFRHNTKMKRMPIHHRYAFIVLLCLASENSPRGVITNLDDEDLAFELEMDVEDWRTLKAKFKSKGLIDFEQNTITVCNWDKRQFASDSSAERVARHREKNKKQECNVTSLLLKRHVTPSDTDTDTDTDSDTDSETYTKTGTEISRIDRQEHQPSLFVLEQDEAIGETDSPNTTLPTVETQPDQPKSSANLSKKKNNVSEDFWVKLCYQHNEFKPESWAECRAIGAARRKTVTPYVLEFGEEETLEMHRDGLLFARQDRFWGAPDKKNFGIITPFQLDKGRTDVRFVGWAESWRSIQSRNPGFIPTAPTGHEATDRLADQFQQRMEYLKRTGQI